MFCWERKSSYLQTLEKTSPKKLPVMHYKMLSTFCSVDANLWGNKKKQSKEHPLLCSEEDFAFLAWS